MTPEQTYKEALQRIADMEVRADRRQRGMVDASIVQDLQRIARVALNNPHHRAGVICKSDHTHQGIGSARRCDEEGGAMRGT